MTALWSWGERKRFNLNQYVTKSKVIGSLFIIEFIYLTNIYWTYTICQVLKGFPGIKTMSLWVQSLNYCLRVWEEEVLIYNVIIRQKFSLYQWFLFTFFYHPTLLTLWQFSLFLGVHKETIAKKRCTGWLKHIYIKRSSYLTNT